MASDQEKRLNLLYNFVLQSYDAGKPEREQLQVVMLQGYTELGTGSNGAGATSHPVGTADVRDPDPRIDDARRNGTLALWVGMAVRPSVLRQQRQLDTESTSGLSVDTLPNPRPIAPLPSALKAYVLAGTMQFCGVVDAGEATDPGVIYNIPAADVFFFREFRDDSLTTKKSREEQWWSTIRACMNRIELGTGLADRLPFDLLSFGTLLDEVKLLQIGFDVIGSREGNVSCDTLSSAIASTAVDSTPAFKVFSMAPLSRAPSQIIDDAISHVKTKWPDIAEGLTPSLMHQIYRCIRAAKIEVPIPHARAFLGKCKDDLKEQDFPSLTKTGRATIGRQALAFAERANGHSPPQPDDHFHVAIILLQGFIMELHERSSELNDSLQRWKSYRKFWAVPLSLPGVLQSLTKHKDDFNIKWMSEMLFRHRTNVAVAVYTYLKEVADRQCLAHQLTQQAYAQVIQARQRQRDDTAADAQRAASAN